jgi:hypothetical protein
MPGSGKSAYLYVLGRQAGAGTLGYWQIGPLTDEYAAFVHEKHTHLSQDWKKTEPDDVPLHFRLFGLSRRRGLIKEGITVESFDCSGEVWLRAFVPGKAREDRVTDFEAINKLRTMAAECAGFLVILDSELGSTVGSLHEEAEKRLLEWQVIFDRLAWLDSGEKGDRIGRPVAIVLNKADLFTLSEDADDDFGLDELIML